MSTHKHYLFRSISTRISIQSIHISVITSNLHPTRKFAYHFARYPRSFACRYAAFRSCILRLYLIRGGCIFESVRLKIAETRFTAFHRCCIQIPTHYDIHSKKSYYRKRFGKREKEKKREKGREKERRDECGKIRMQRHLNDKKMHTQTYFSFLVSLIKLECC